MMLMMVFFLLYGRVGLNQGLAAFFISWNTVGDAISMAMAKSAELCFMPCVDKRLIWKVGQWAVL